MYEIKPWLNDDTQNVRGLQKILDLASVYNVAGENILYDANGLFDVDYIGISNNNYTGWLYSKSSSGLPYPKIVKNNGFEFFFPAGLGNTTLQRFSLRKPLRASGKLPTIGGRELYSLHDSDDVTVSFMIKADGAVNVQTRFICTFNDGSSNLEEMGNTLKIEGDNTWHTYVSNLTAFPNFDTLKTASNVNNFTFDILISLDNSQYDNTKVTVNIKEIKMEYGKVATGFSYSPEDVIGNILFEYLDAIYPQPPKDSGTYVLNAIVMNGYPNYKWVKTE